MTNAYHAINWVDTGKNSFTLERLSIKLICQLDIVRSDYVGKGMFILSKMNGDDKRKEYLCL